MLLLVRTYAESEATTGVEESCKANGDDSDDGGVMLLVGPLGDNPGMASA